MRVVLVTGSRDWDDPYPVHRALYSEFFGTDEQLIVMHGDCPRGADKHAKDWCASMAHVGVREDAHPAKWEIHGKASGFIRNQQMVDEGAGICLAFIRNNSRGATDCARRAEKAGIPTHYFRQ